MVILCPAGHQTQQNTEREGSSDCNIGLVAQIFELLGSGVGVGGEFSGFFFKSKLSSQFPVCMFIFVYIIHGGIVSNPALRKALDLKLKTYNLIFF